ncbi:MAG: NfeD family protein, partial [Actinomycetota bacterium]
HAQSAPGAVHLIRLDGAVGLSSVPHVERALEAAAADEAALAVLVLDAPAGRRDAVVPVADSLLDAEVATTAFVDGRALSAASLVAVASERIVFAPGAVLGAAEPALPTSGGAQTTDAKVVATMSEAFRSAAEARDRDPDVAVGMVDPTVEVAGLAGASRLARLDADAAEAFGYLDARADDLDQLLEQRGLEQAPRVEATPRATERIVEVITHPLVAATLLALGVVLPVLELFLGAFGLISATGVAALGTFFYGHVLTGLAGGQEVVVILVGLGLMVLEIFVVPGFGVPGILGFAAVLGGGWLSIVGSDLGLVTTGQMVSTGATVAIAFVAIAIGLIVLLSLVSRQRSEGREDEPSGGQQTPRWLRWFGDGDRLARDEEPSLEPGSDLDDGAPLSTAAAAASREGARGVAASDLHPAGIADFNGYRVDVVTTGDYLDKGEAVEVVRAERYRRVVRRARG